MSRQTNIYLDIDGVILANETNLAAHSTEFIRYIVTNYPIYWLTTHCQGDATVPLKHIGHLFDPDTRKLLQQIRPTTWNNAKTEAIDFAVPFLWFDDDLYPDEKEDLIQHGALSNWIEVDLKHDPNRLANILTRFPKA